MQFILKLFLFVLLVTSLPTVSSAIVSPSHQIVKSHKLKLKEKAAIWLLKRKLKKAKKHWNHALTVTNDTTDCATILLNTGDKIAVKLLKTTEDDVVFKRCGTRKSVITMSKSDIFQIVLSDGLVIFDSNRNPIKSHRTKSSKPNYGYAVLAVLTGLFSLMVFGTFPGVSIIFGIIALIIAYISYARHHKA